MYQETHLDIFRETSLYWLSETLNMSKYEDGIVGYKSDGEKKSLDLLNGVAGIGLVILSFLSEQDMFWEDLLLLD